MSENNLTGNIFYFARDAAAQSVDAPTTRAPETRFVEAAKTGDRAAFDELYKIFAPVVHGIILARLPFDDAPDAVQEVFISAYKNLPNLEDANAFGAWLAAIARNRANDFYRRARPTEELPEDLSGGENLQTRQEAREILTAIRALPDSYRETLILRLVEGMTGAEIAERCGLTPESVRVNLHRGMKMLREKLGLRVER